MIPDLIKKEMMQWFDKSPEATFYERIELQNQAYEKYETFDYSIRYGLITRHILENMSIVVTPGEKITGHIKEIIPSQAQRDLMEELSRTWWDVSEEQRQEQCFWYYSDGWIKRRAPWYFTLGHLAFDWQGILNNGLGWYSRRSEEMLSLDKADGDLDKTAFLKGSAHIYESLSLFIDRYAEEAEQAGEAEVARICRNISRGQARTFREALQLMWFVILVSQKVAGCGVFCFSRMDQYLLPFFENDLKEGRLTEEEALHLIMEFYNKNNDIMTPADHMSQETDCVVNNLELTYDDPNYIMLGGKLADGSSGVNRLTWLFVDAAHQMKLRNPFLIVRYFKGIEEDFYLKVAQAMKDNATIVIYNDDTMMPAIRACGVDEEDVSEYAFFGCNDPLIPAKEGGLRQLWFNLAWPLELALGNGKPLSGEPVKGFDLRDRMIGLMTGAYGGKVADPAPEITSMEQLLEIYRVQLETLFDEYHTKLQDDLAFEAKYNRLRFEDCFLQGTVENMTTWNIGGTKYHKIIVQGSGIATAVDSLAALDHVVFKTRQYSLKEVRRALADNFEGHEELRKALVKAPKFGNDREEADRFAGIVSNMFCDTVQAHINTGSLYNYMPTLSTDRAFTDMGLDLAATADGRRQGDPISENQSPSVGMDHEGMTALLNSVSRIPFNRITGGPLNLSLHPSSIEGHTGLNKLASLMKVFLNKGGMQVQLNVVGRKEMQDAQEHPERHKNLCVRVTGYAAYFTQMGKKAQDELIERTEN